VLQSETAEVVSPPKEQKLREETRKLTLVKWELIQLPETPTAEKCTGIQITRNPQVTAWQVLNGDDVETEKKLDPSLTCHPSPRRARRLSRLPPSGLPPAQMSLWLWIQTSTQFALSERTFPLTGFNMCPSDSLWNSARSLCLPSSASSSQLLLFCSFGLCFLSTLWFSIFSLLSSLESHSTVK